MYEDFCFFSERGAGSSSSVDAAAAADAAPDLGCRGTLSPEPALRFFDAFSFLASVFESLISAFCN